MSVDSASVQRTQLPLFYIEIVISHFLYLLYVNVSDILDEDSSYVMSDPGLRSCMRKYSLKSAMIPEKIFIEVCHDT